MSQRGWAVVHAIDEREKEIGFWLRYSKRLTPEERRRLARDDFAPVVRPLEPEWKPGDELKAATNLTITIDAVRWSRGAYRTAYSVRDFRPRLMRRTPHGRDPSMPKRRENESIEGYAERVEGWDQERSKEPTAEAIEDARQDGNYTKAAALAVPESDDVVDDSVLESITKNGLRNYEVLNAKRLRQRDERNLASRLRQVTAQARKRGIDVTPEIEDLKKRLDALERKIAA